MKQKKTILTISILLLVSCNKYLNEKSDKSLSTPSSLADLQGLLDNTNFVQNYFIGAGEVSSTDYYLNDASYSSLSYDEDKRMYTWQPENLFYAGTTTQTEWFTCFRGIYISNAVLSILPDIPENNSSDGKDIKGQAYLWRAFRYYDAAQVWCPAYDSSTSSKDLGLPLRLDPDFNLPSVRSSVKTTYEQVLSDIRESIPLLPVTPLSKIRPSKAAAYGLMARVCLSMRNYADAGKYADSCLQFGDLLMDYNSLTASKSYPVADLNAEVILLARMTTSKPLVSSIACIDSTLYNSYTSNDLRKSIFFAPNTNGTYKFKGNYSGSSYYFVGISTDEMYLVRAECYARTGNIAAAMADLNTLLVKRWKIGTFQPLTAHSAEAALAIILSERRKELLMRGLRWMDIKRLNKQGANITLARSVNGTTYTLPPNDLRYALPLPDDIISLSGMQQNPR